MLICAKADPGTGSSSQLNRNKPVIFGQSFSDWRNFDSCIEFLHDLRNSVCLVKYVTPSATLEQIFCNATKFNFKTNLDSYAKWTLGMPQYQQIFCCVYFLLIYSLIVYDDWCFFFVVVLNCVPIFCCLIIWVIEFL